MHLTSLLSLIPAKIPTWKDNRSEVKTSENNGSNEKKKTSWVFYESCQTVLLKLWTWQKEGLRGEQCGWYLKKDRVLHNRQWCMLIYTASWHGLRAVQQSKNGKEQFSPKGGSRRGHSAFYPKFFLGGSSTEWVVQYCEFQGWSTFLWKPSSLMIQ